MNNENREKILEDFVKKLVNEFPTGDGIALKIYVFYKAYIRGKKIVKN